MIPERHIPAIEDDRIAQLGEADAADMLDLATLTKPGPFTLKALSLGDFWGVRENGRLIATAASGRTGRLSELSGVARIRISRAGTGQAAVAVRGGKNLR